MITNKEKAWDSRDNNRNDFDSTHNAASRQNEDAFNSNELDDDELKEDEDAYTNDLKPTFNQEDLNDEDEEYDRPAEVPGEEDDNELPDESQTRKKGSGYHSQQEVDQPTRGADTSYSEKNDVTPPNKKEFPSQGPAKTDFESRPQGRTTGRMIGHEPGTEGI